jgi:serine/threonine protein kinase
MTIAAGTRLGRYEIRPLLGVGGMGEVCLAHGAKLERAVALKLIPPSAIVTARRRARRPRG